MVTQAAKRKNQGNVQIIDYAKKRGVNKDKKPKVEEEEEVQEASMESKVKFFPYCRNILVWNVKLSCYYVTYCLF